MTKEEFLEALKDVEVLISKRPFWQRGLLDESQKSTSDIPRKVVVEK